MRYDVIVKQQSGAQDVTHVLTAGREICFALSGSCYPFCRSQPLYRWDINTMWHHLTASLQSYDVMLVLGWQENMFLPAREQRVLR